MREHYILEGRETKAVDLMTWARWFENAETRVIAKTESGNTVISTVFLGLDHSFGSGPPLIFETMVFGGNLDQEQVRYSTYDEAEKGHADMVERVKAQMS